MSPFYGEMTGSRGSRGTVTKQGTKEYGLSAHIRGYNIGVRIYCYNLDGKDIIAIYKTTGSNGDESDDKDIYIIHEKGE